jgi:hypothetical protein
MRLSKLAKLSEGAVSNQLIDGGCGAAFVGVKVNMLMCRSGFPKIL